MKREQQQITDIRAMLDDLQEDADALLSHLREHHHCRVCDIGLNRVREAKTVLTRIDWALDDLRKQVAR